MTQIAASNATKHKIKAVFSPYNLLKTDLLVLSYWFTECFYLAHLLYINTQKTPAFCADEWLKASFNILWLSL